MSRPYSGVAVTQHLTACLKVKKAWISTFTPKYIFNDWATRLLRQPYFYLQAVKDVRNATPGIFRTFAKLRTNDYSPPSVCLCVLHSVQMKNSVPTEQILMKFGV